MALNLLFGLPPAPLTNSDGNSAGRIFARVEKKKPLREERRKTVTSLMRRNHGRKPDILCYGVWRLASATVVKIIVRIWGVKRNENIFYSSADQAQP